MGSAGAPLIKVVGVNAQPLVVGIHKGTIMSKNHANIGIMLQTIMNHASAIMPKASMYVLHYSTH